MTDIHYRADTNQFYTTVYQDGKRRQITARTRKGVEERVAAIAEAEQNWNDALAGAGIEAAEPEPQIDIARARAEAQHRADLAEIRRLTAAVSSAEVYRETIEKYAPLLTVPQLRPERGPAERPAHTWVLVLSDWHVGQKTESDTTGELFEQTLDLTRGQVHDLIDTTLDLHRIASRGTQIDDLYILNLGDDHEGSGMRPRQAVEIDESVTKQCMDVVDLKAELLQNMLGRFRRVTYHNVGGNHDRISQKAGLAGLGELNYHDTYSWLAGAVLQREFRDAQAKGRLRIKNWTSFFGYEIIAGQRFVFEHGASFRTSSGSYGGIGWYPIQNAGGKYIQMLDGADMVVFGHYHTGACLPLARGWQVLNGALPPSTAYVQSNFKKIAVPSQMLLDLHPKHGLTQFRPIYLPHSGIAQPGAAWLNAAAEAEEWSALGQ